MDRAYYEKQIDNILEGYQNETLSASDYYRVKTIDALIDITDEVALQKIYSFTSAFLD